MEKKISIPNVHLTLVSSNRKTGKIPVSTTSAESCPSACPFKQNGCYADGGPLAMHWAKVTKRERGEAWKGFLGKIASLPTGQFWRHNQAGDLPGVDNNIDGRLLAQLCAANSGKRGFTYTHKPVLKNSKNRKAIAKANERGFTVNLSANTLPEADKLSELDIAPVVVVVAPEYGRKVEKNQYTETLPEYRKRVADLPKQTPKGKRIVVCPAQINDTSCADCQLCQKQRGIIVAFAAHGTSKREATEIAKG